MEEVYSGTWYLRERGEFIKYKESSSWVWGKIKYRSKITEEVRHSREKRL